MPQTRQEIAKRSYEKHREKRILCTRAGQYKKLYGITIEQYWEMVNQQNNLCAVCKNPPNINNLAVDHCHKTGKVRGLLCQSCNSGIGKLRDNKELLLAAIQYLDKYNVDQN
jgi:hypothetical protein